MRTLRLEIVDKDVDSAGLKLMEPVSHLRVTIEDRGVYETANIMHVDVPFQGTDLLQWLQDVAGPENPPPFTIGVL